MTTSILFKSLIISLVCVYANPCISFAKSNAVLQTDTIKANSPQLLAEDSLSRQVFNYWTKKNEQVTYYISHWSNGISRIIDSNDNRLSFKTVREKDPFTGELTGKFASIQDYLDKNYPITRGKLSLPNGYMVIVKKRKCILYTPLGISYSIEVTNPTVNTVMDCNSPSGLNNRIGWYIENRSRTTKVFGVNGNELVNLSSFEIPTFNFTIDGGYYDEKTNNMYYVLDYHEAHFNKSLDGYMMKAVSATTGKGETPVTVEDLKAQKAILVYALPSDSIISITNNENVASVNYANGDYIKISKLQFGTVYDCNVHRPLGVWKASLTPDKKVLSSFTYENGIYKGLVYDAFIRHSEYGECLSNPDMVNRSMMTNEGYDYKFRLFNPAQNRYMSIEDNGDITEYVEAKRAQEQKQQLEEFKKKSQPIYNAYCAKYGKGNVDAILKNGTLRVGMPISVIKALCNCYMTDDWGHIQWYKVMYSGYEYDLTNNSIKTYSTSFGAKVWYIGVTNGTVKYLGRRPY